MSQWRDSGGFAYPEDPRARLLQLLNWSLPCGRPLFNIAVRIHWTTLLVPFLLVPFAPGQTAGDFGGWLATVLVIGAVLFGSIYLHELGHGVTTLRCGYPMREIVLYFMGGVAIGGRGRNNVNHDFAIIAFGPFVNLVLLAIGYGALNLMILPLGLTAWNGWYLGWPILSFEYIAFIMYQTNLGLAVFNLIPVFPLDGGGMLRAALSMKWNANAVTYRMATIGMWVIAPAMVILGIYYHQILLSCIGLMAWQACYNERILAQHVPIYENTHGGGFAIPKGYGGWHDSSGEEPVYGGYAAQRAAERKAEAVSAPAKKPGFFARMADAREQKQAEQAVADRAKVDELLEKISRDGITSLTPKEREFLMNASKRYQS